jgi:hypothetical protein
MHNTRPTRDRGGDGLVPTKERIKIASAGAMTRMKSPANHSLTLL